jgi:glycosyltransferase involved in cell wall biosynthesis
VRAKLTVLVPCRNEEEMLPGALESVRWADELYVVDSFSTDKSLEIARSFGARVEQHEYVNSATQKNWAIPRATHEWVLVLDCDERVTPELAAEVQRVLEDPKHDGYRIRRRSFFLGCEIRHCGWERDAVLRLFRRDRGRYLDREVHADVAVEGGGVGWLEGRLLHYTVRSFDQYFEKFGRYTTWAAGDLERKGARANAFNLLLRPAARFLKMYVLRLGFLDGLHGLVLCALAAVSVFTKYAKLWERTRARQKETL